MKPVVAIIAHPDDETVMAGTLAKLSETRDVYMICVTSGDAGENTDSKKESLLMLDREDELRASAKVLGVKHVSFLGFKDGSLCNSSYHDLASKIENKLNELKPDIIITFEPRGITGHIDHIVVSMVTSYLYNRLSYVKTVMYTCMSEAQRTIAAGLPEYFIFFPPGYKKSDVDEVIDVTPFWDKKITAIQCHHSQKKDVETFLLPIQQRAPKEEYFLILKK